MKLKAYPNFALRSLQSAAHRAPNHAQADDVVWVRSPSRPHIVKIVHRLWQTGYLETKRGLDGGFRLALPASDISVGDNIGSTEEPLEMMECWNPERNSCVSAD